jgi:hypothetical protein
MIIQREIGNIRGNHYGVLRLVNSDNSDMDEEAIKASIEYINSFNLIQRNEIKKYFYSKS